MQCIWSTVAGDMLFMCHFIHTLSTLCERSADQADQTVIIVLNGRNR